MSKVKLGVGLCGSFCNHSAVLNILDKLDQKKYDVTFFVSERVKNISTRFGSNEFLLDELKKISKKDVVSTIVDAEQYGPKIPLDIMLLLPMTATSLNKLASGIYDNGLLVATKAHLRNNKPVVIGIASNDFLGISSINLFKMINQKNIFFIPFGQDDYVNKPNSLVSNFALTFDTLESALNNKQIQPLLIEYKGE